MPDRFSWDYLHGTTGIFVTTYRPITTRRANTFPTVGIVPVIGKLPAELLPFLNFVGWRLGAERFCCVPLRTGREVR